MHPSAAFILIAYAAVSLACRSDSKSPGTEPYSYEEIAELADSCDYIDIVFYGNSASMSQNEPAAIRSTFSFISTQKVEKLDCPGRGRISFVGRGHILAEADLHVGPACAFLAFIDDGVMIHANQLSSQGAAFFRGILAQIDGVN